MSKNLQDQVKGLSKKLQMLALSPGYIDTYATEGVRDFYVGWQTVNTACITAGYEDGGGDLTYVSGQLRRLLDSFPADKTTVGVLEVFPLCLESAFVFGSYIEKLERIAKAAPS